MSALGTDLVALTCILGGAMVSGAVTLAILDGNERADAPCTVEAVAVRPKVVVSRNGEARVMVVSPDVRVHSRRGCGVGVAEAVEIHLDGRLRHLEAVEAELNGLERTLELQLGGLEAELEAQIQEEVEASLHLEMENLEEALGRIGG